MTDSAGYPRPAAPDRTRLASARAALKAQQKVGDYVCGCFAALGRDPFFPPLVSHWQTYHPDSLAVLKDAQARRTDLDPRPEAAQERGRAHYRFTCSPEWRKANLSSALELEARHNDGRRGDLP